MCFSVWFSILALLSILAQSYAASILTLSGDLSNSTQRRDSASYVQAAYFTNWGIYAPNFQPTDIDPSHLTHILYAFAAVSPATGQILLSDIWADQEKLFPGDSPSEPGNNLYGCLKQLYLLKLAHRQVKLLLSVGGWNFSQDGDFSFLTDSDLREAFVASAVLLVKNYGFDGIDIDYEYPANFAEGQGLLSLMTSLRNAFDQLAIANGDTTPYELTMAVSAVSQNNAYIPVQELDQVLTYWNLMAYDYSGPWLTFADNQANLYGGARTGVSTSAAINYYITSGATPRKIIMGIPLYGRAFENTQGLGLPYSGIGPGTYGPGVYSDKYLPLPGAEVFEDFVNVASYSYDPVELELVSYDTPDIVRVKAGYVMSQLLGGCMFWELSTDKTGSDSLVQTAGVTLGQLDQTLNHIYYPDSEWDNIRNNMGAKPAGTMSTPIPITSPTTTALTAAPTPSVPAYSCMCDGVSDWNTTAMYVGGDEAVYDGQLWTAKWWTENDIPGGAAGVWVNDGTCD